MNIQCVTKQQQELLNEIWACDSEDDINELLEAVEPEYRQEVLLLAECVFLAHLDDLVLSETDCAEARAEITALRMKL
jgi:hypothetical protein